MSALPPSACRFQLIGQTLRDGAAVGLRCPDGAVIPCVVAFLGEHGSSRAERESAGAPGGCEEEECTWDTHIALVAELPSLSPHPSTLGSHCWGSSAPVEGVELSIFGSDLVGRFRAGAPTHTHISKWSIHIHTVRHAFAAGTL